jgi:hypothetical protein
MPARVRHLNCRTPNPTKKPSSLQEVKILKDASLKEDGDAALAMTVDIFISLFVAAVHYPE